TCWRFIRCIPGACRVAKYSAQNEARAAAGCERRTPRRLSVMTHRECVIKALVCRENATDEEILHTVSEFERILSESMISDQVHAARVMEGFARRARMEQQRAAQAMKDFASE